MRQDHHDELGLLLTAATDWRNAGNNVGVQIDRIGTTFPDGSEVTLIWEINRDDAEVLVWEGWVVKAL